MPAQLRSPKEIIHDKAIRAVREFIPQEILNYRKEDIPYLKSRDIDKLTGRILLLCEQGRRNVIDIDKLVERIDGTIERDPLFSSEEDITISAENSSFIIKVSSFAADEESRTTIAHELGHYFLHYAAPVLDREAPFSYRFFKKESSCFEQQADYFAASLTMPKEEFARKVKEFSGNSNFYTELASYFSVPDREAALRCKRLGLTTTRYEGVGAE